MTAHLRTLRDIAAIVLMDDLVALAGSQSFQIGQQPLFVRIGQAGAVEVAAVAVAGEGSVVGLAETLADSARLADEPTARRIDQVIAAVEFLRPLGR